MDSLKYNVITVEGKDAGQIDLDPAVFATSGKTSLVHDTVRWQLAKRRSGTHQAMTRSMMKGGGKKPWKQKGTGRARAGSGISPLWVGGASIHGPLPRDYNFRLTKRTRRQALSAVLTDKVASQTLIVLDKLDLAKAKTKLMAAIFEKIGASDARAVLMVSGDSGAESLRRSSRNLADVSTLSVEGINVYDLLRHKYLVGTKEGILALQKRVKGEA